MCSFFGSSRSQNSIGHMRQTFRILSWGCFRLQTSNVSMPNYTQCSNLGVVGVISLPNVVFTHVAKPAAKKVAYTKPRQKLGSTNGSVQRNQWGQNHIDFNGFWCTQSGPPSSYKMKLPRCSMGLLYLPTFTPKTTQMQVNRPHIEHLG